MKLSQNTLAVLRNLSKISRGLFTTPGKTKSQMVYTEATVAETFPVEARIYRHAYEIVASGHSDINPIRESIELDDDQTARLEQALGAKTRVQ